MADHKFYNINVGPQIVDRNHPYRENSDPQNKLTYNFVTDPRLRRGHNFGVIYVTSSNYETNEPLKRSQDGLRKSSDHHHEERNKKQNEEMRVILPDNRRNFGICTEKVINTVRPKPITFEVEIQTDKLPPRPQSPLIHPEKTGIDIDTQIEDGELFNFDEEVAPLVHVIISKTLEESRREVLEEEERAEIKSQKKKYEQIEKEDQQRVGLIEKQERERYEAKKKKKAEKAIRIANTILFQKKLCSRTIGKLYVSTIRNHSIQTLESQSLFKNPEVNDYFTVLLPELQSIAEKTYKNDYVVVNTLNDMLMQSKRSNNITRHKEAIASEQRRKEQMEQERIRRHEEEEAEKLRQKEERRKRRHERVLNELRKTITEELLINKEFVDDVDAIYDINGYYQKTKLTTCLGGPIGQFAILICYLNKLTPDFLNEDKIGKIIDLYLPTSHKFFLPYKAEDLEEYKGIDENITAMDEINKAEDDQYKTILPKVMSRAIEYDDMLPMIFETISSNDFGLTKIKDVYKMLLKVLMQRFKETLDSGKVDFVLIDPLTEEIPLNSICLVNGEIIPREKLPETVIPKKNVPAAAKKVPVKITHDQFWYEKIITFPTVSEKLKIIAINKNFDRIFRENALDCINKLYKLEPEKEAITLGLNEEYDRLIESISKQLAQKHQKEIVTLDIKLMNDAVDDEEEGEEGGEAQA